MSRTEEIGSQIMWILGHTLFTLIAVCVVRGGYQFYQDYMSLEAATQSFDLSMLSVDEKNELMEELLSEPLPPKRK